MDTKQYEKKIISYEVTSQSYQRTTSRNIKKIEISAEMKQLKLSENVSTIGLVKQKFKNIVNSIIRITQFILDLAEFDSKRLIYKMLL